MRGFCLWHCNGFQPDLEPYPAHVTTNAHNAADVMHEMHVMHVTHVTRR